VILEWFASTIATVVGAVLGAILPDGEALGLIVPEGVIRNYSFLNTFLPVSEVVATAGIWFAVQGSFILYAQIKLVMNLIRGAGA
jgi:hypothetical protein